MKSFSNGAGPSGNPGGKPSGTQAIAEESRIHQLKDI
jgi:hypothetical protein